MQYFIRAVAALAFVAVLTTAAVTSAQAAKPRSYPLVCRAGGSMVITFTHSFLIIIEIRFRKARHAASRQSPGPGECAWLDRPLGNNEPSKLLGYIRKRLPTANVTCRGSRCELSHFSGASKAGVKKARTANYLIKAVKRGATFQLHAYNCRNLPKKRRCRRGKTWLRITRFGP